MPRENWPSLRTSERLPGKGEKAMSTHEYPITAQARSANSGSLRMAREKAVAFETVQTLRATARDVLVAHAITGSAVASLAIIAAPHLEMLLRCIFHGRG
jgi:hypothetical protein